MKDRLLEALTRFEKSRVLVGGDLMLDVGYVGTADRISPEAPVLILNVLQEVFEPGGAANAAMNARMLGGDVDAMGLIGDDEAGDQLMSCFASAGIDTSLIVRVPDRPTTQKTRAFAQGRHLIRFDYEETSPVGETSVRDLLRKFRARTALYDAVLLSDYGKGLGQPLLYRGIMECCKQKGIPVLIDPKAGDWELYQGADLIKPNDKEAQWLCDASFRGDPLEKIGPVLTEKFGASFLISCGAEGMYLWERDDPVQAFHFPALATHVEDVTGAGDTVSATMTLCLGNQLNLREAVLLASVAAAVVVSKPGTAKMEADELTRYLEEEKVPLIAGMPLDRKDMKRSEG